MLKPVSLKLAQDIVLLAQRGFAATDTYGDGVVRMAKRVANNDESVVWLDQKTGIVRPPALISDYRAVVARRIDRDNFNPDAIGV